jgi:hypothetical protein
LLTSPADAGQQTLAERVRRQKGQIEVQILREFSPVDLPELVKESDLIARVVVLDSGHARLSKDERSMYSEFTVQVLDQFFSARSLKLTEKQRSGMWVELSSRCQKIWNRERGRVPIGEFTQELIRILGPR